MNRNFPWILLAVILATVFAINSWKINHGLVKGSGKPVIKIGVVMPMSGNMAATGEMGRAGMLLRLKELQSDKNSKFDYKIVFEDDQFVFSRTAMSIKKFKDIDHVDVVMTMWGYGSEIALPLLKDDPNILHLNVDRWTDGKGANDFVCGASMDAYISKLITLLKRFDYRRVVFIGTAEQGTEFSRKKLEQELPKNGIQFIESTTVSTEVRDLRTWILKVKEMHPDLILECLQMPTAQIFLKQMHDLGITTPVGHSTIGVFEVDPYLSENSWQIYPSMPTEDWKARFKAEYHKDTLYPAPQFYNTLSLLINACERLDGNRKPTTSELITSIKSIGEFDGSTGKIHFVPPNKYDAPVSYFVFHNGKPEVTTLDELEKLKEKK